VCERLFTCARRHSNETDASRSVRHHLSGCEQVPSLCNAARSARKACNDPWLSQAAPKEHVSRVADAFNCNAARMAPRMEWKIYFIAGAQAPSEIRHRHYPRAAPNENVNSSQLLTVARQSLQPLFKSTRSLLFNSDVSACDRKKNNKKETKKETLARDGSHLQLSKWRRLISGRRDH
jgi:hypothetical protein